MAMLKDKRRSPVWRTKGWPIKIFLHEPQLGMFSSFYKETVSKQWGNSRFDYSKTNQYKPGNEIS